MRLQGDHYSTLSSKCATVLRSPQCVRSHRRFQNDVRLLGLADELQLAVVSVDHRLAPEAKWPLPLDDCVAAACWLIENSQSSFGTSRLLIGGESSGAHLCAAALLRLSSTLAGPTPFAAANLVCVLQGLDPPGGFRVSPAFCAC